MENIFKSIIAIGGATASFIWGEWNALLTVLLLFVVVDYISGVIAAGFDGKLNSHAGFKGIAKKVAIFFIIAVAHGVDVALGGDTHLFRDIAVWFYLANELLSILENIGRMGVPIPSKLQDAVEVLKSKGDK